MCHREQVSRCEQTPPPLRLPSLAVSSGRGGVSIRGADVEPGKASGSGPARSTHRGVSDEGVWGVGLELRSLSPCSARVLMLYGSVGMGLALPFAMLDFTGRSAGQLHAAPFLPWAAPGAQSQMERGRSVEEGAARAPVPWARRAGLKRP